MNTKKNYRAMVELRKRHYLKLKDAATILNIDPANLSRFETGKKDYPKASLSYAIAFDFSTDLSRWKHTRINYEDIVHRCFSLIEEIEALPKTYKNLKRIDGLHAIVAHLSQDDKAYDN